MSSITNILVGANLAFAESQLASLLTEKVTNPTLTTATIQLVENNADRLELAIFNVGGDTATVHFDPALNNTYGIPLAAGVGFLILKLRDDLSLMTRPWYGKSNSTSTLLTVIELLRIVGNQPAAK